MMWNCCRKVYETATEINMFVSSVLQFVASVLESKLQLAPLTKNVIMAVLTPNLVIQLTAFTAFETGRNSWILYSVIMCIFPYQPLFLSLKREVFPSLMSNNSYTTHGFTNFMRINQIFNDKFNEKPHKISHALWDYLDIFKTYYWYSEVKPDMSIDSTKKVKSFLIWLSHILLTIFTTCNPLMQKI